jgi:4'-phosphopantetheinyl transferase EntD
MRSPFPDDVAFVVRESSPAEEEAIAAELLPDERMLLSADASPSRLADFGLGRACGREALRRAGAWTGGAPPPILRRERMPVWPTGYVGSIAHTPGAAAAVAAGAARYLGLGVDIEAFERDATAIGTRILLPEERTAVEGLPSSAIILCFCAKEAVYKALNPITGVYLGFQEVRLHLPARGLTIKAGKLGELEWELLKESGAKYPVGTRGIVGWSVEGPWLVAGAWLKA